VAGSLSPAGAVLNLIARFWPQVRHAIGADVPIDARHPPADLLHKRQKSAYSPVVGDLAVLDAHDIDRLEVDPAVSGSARNRAFTSTRACVSPLSLVTPSSN
jgi:hypothetical protein